MFRQRGQQSTTCERKFCFAHVFQPRLFKLVRLQPQCQASHVWHTQAGLHYGRSVRVRPRHLSDRSSQTRKTTPSFSDVVFLLSRSMFEVGARSNTCSRQIHPHCVNYPYRILYSFPTCCGISLEVYCSSRKVQQTPFTQRRSPLRRALRKHTR